VMILLIILKNKDGQVWSNIIPLVKRLINVY
jgi:hypothetical protein